MEFLKSCFVFLTVLFFASSGLAEVVQFSECPESDANAPANCIIHEVKVNPCPQATRNKPCIIKEGNEASISFDYTPSFSGDLQNTAGWWNAGTYLRFTGMQESACESTACPAVAGTRQTYNYSLTISPGYPKRVFPIMWNLSNAEGQKCCFIINIRITK